MQVCIVVVADAGYWYLEQMSAITVDGIPALIAPDSTRRRKTAKRSGPSGGAYDFMRGVGRRTRRLASSSDVIVPILTCAVSQRRAHISPQVT